MADKKYLVMLVLMIINYTNCELNCSIHKRTCEINNRSREMYGDVQEGFVTDFEFEKLLYPRGDKRKLPALSRALRDYYDCSEMLIESVTPSGISRSIVVMIFQGSSARLPCKLCLEPATMNEPTWLYAKFAAKEEFELIREYDRLTIEEQGTITIYNVVPGDDGLFWCTFGDGGGGMVLIEIVDTEPYNVVKPPASRGPHAVPAETYEGMTLFTQWTRWSECSVCDRVGRRRRYGVCYVKLSQELIVSYIVDPEGMMERYTLFDLDKKIIELFETFPEGLPCRSQFLPQEMRELDVIQQRPSEIMIGLCKVPCKEKRKRNNITITWSFDDDGAVIYPLTQKLPKQPPLPVRDTIFADFGQRIVIRCPGTTLRDVPIQWRVGTKVLVPRDVDKGSGGRVYLNPRDHLVFTIITYSDENLYSCWQRENLAGTVKLYVWAGARPRWGRAAWLLLAAALVVAARSAARPAPGLLDRQSVLYHLY